MGKMLLRACLWLLLLLATPSLSFVRLGDVEGEHSLFHPFDLSFADWRYGGATVTTSRMIRLTPNTQSRRGWIFNEYELNDDNWQISMDFQIHSDYHIGGDGMALWVLDKHLHPTAGRKQNRKLDFKWLDGDLFGIRSEWPSQSEGFGVIFDTYDNDQKRDNPLIYTVVVRNDTETERLAKMDSGNSDDTEKSDGEKKRGKFEWDFETDFAKSRYKKLPTDELGEIVPDSSPVCTMDYRNAGTQSVLIRYLYGVLHVYFKKGGDRSVRHSGKKGLKNYLKKKKNKNGDKDKDAGAENNDDDWMYCLSVDIGLGSKGKYLALSAMTGAVADNHDIELLSFRFLDVTKRTGESQGSLKEASAMFGKFPGLDDAHLKHVGYVGRSVPWMHLLFWVFVTVLNAGLAVLVAMEYAAYNDYTKNRNALSYMRAVNATIQGEYALHFSMTMLLVVFHLSHWSHLLILAINMPSLLLKLYGVMTDQWLAQVSQLRAVKPGGKSLMDFLDTANRGSVIGFVLKVLTNAVTFYLSVRQVFD